MNIRRLWWLGATGVLALLIGALLAIPVWAAPSDQADGPVPDTYTTMHEACETGDLQGMTDAMDTITDEDWAAMGEHMNDDHHGAMGSGMMGMGGPSGMMGW